MNWLPFIYPKRADYKLYKTKRPTKRSSTEWFISSIIPRDMYVGARPKKARKWDDARTQLQPIAVTNERTGFLPLWKQRNEFQQIKQNRAIFVWMKKDPIKVRRKQSYNKHLIRRLISQYGWIFLLVELYFGSPKGPKGSPKYCRLVKIPSQIGYSAV